MIHRILVVALALLVSLAAEDVVLARGFGGASLGSAIRQGAPLTGLRGPGAGQLRMALSPTRIRQPFINVASPAGMVVAPAFGGSTVSFDLGGGIGMALSSGPRMSGGFFGAGEVSPGRTGSRPYTYGGATTGDYEGIVVPVLAVPQEQIVEDLRSHLRSVKPAVFSAEWYATHQQAWSPAGDSFDPWASSKSNDVQTWLGLDTNPSYYDYAVDRQGAMYAYRDGQKAGLAVQSRKDAESIASASAFDSSSQWLPLGVWAAVEPKGTVSSLLLQLSVSPHGAIRGTYYVLASGAAGAMTGAVDKKSQIAAWKGQDIEGAVVETGLFDLTADSIRLLVHRQDGWTQIWNVFRLDAADMQAPASSDGVE